MINGLMVKVEELERDFNPSNLSIDVHYNGVCSSGYFFFGNGLKNLLEEFLEYEKSEWTEERYEEYSEGYLPITSLSMIRWQDE